MCDEVLAGLATTIERTPTTAQPLQDHPVHVQSQGGNQRDCVGHKNTGDQPLPDREDKDCQDRRRDAWGPDGLGDAFQGCLVLSDGSNSCEDRGEGKRHGYNGSLVTLVGARTPPV